MSNSKIQTTQSSAKSSPLFTVKFVAANRGVQTEQRVNGRRAFPDRSGAQPKIGESWTVQVVGENPQQSVHFVKCLELVSAPLVTAAASHLEVVEYQPAQPVQMRPPLMQVLRAPGNTLMARAIAWLSPTDAIDLSTLRFAMAKRCIAGDTTASLLLAQLATTFESAEQQSEMVEIASRAIKSASAHDVRVGEIALGLFTSRKDMVQLTADKAALARETLDYARLIKQLKAQGETTAAELVAKVSSVKEALDVKRAAHKEAMAAGKKALSDAELELHFTYHEDLVPNVLGHLTAKEACQSKVEQLHTQLAAELEALEQHVSNILTQS